MNNCGITNLEMEKQKLMDLDVESLQLICVNPYEVNPITQQNTSTIKISAELVPKDEPSTSQQNLFPISGGEFYIPREKKIKLEMEEFSDLSLYLQSKPKSQNSVDELNTPIFDANLPGYDLNFDYSQSNHFIKLESDSYGNNLISNNIYENNSIDVKKFNNNEYKTSEFDNIQTENSVTNVVSPASENGSVYGHLNTRSNNLSDISYSLGHPSGKTETMYSNASSPVTDVHQPQSGVTTPEGSICCSNCPTPKLSLNVNLRPTQKFDLTTPSILNDVVDLENGNFNILDYMQSEVSGDIINVENLFESSNEKTGLQSGKGKEIKESQLHPLTAHKRPRKRRLVEDDDEDYVPPCERNAVKRRLSSLDVSDLDSQDEDEVVTKSKGKARGRPPKRTGSISSECSKDGDASKYRELRDKNNEASRRSRLKRKVKEQGLESEADELYSKNIKLKAQVEELEKLVTKFREDLFKIMIRK